MPILVGTDGTQKMSKSLGNYIGVADAPDEQFGKAMSIPDTLMPDWFRLCTPLPEERISSLVDSSTTHPRQAKEVLARSIVEQYHTVPDAEHAAEEFRKRFTEGGLPTEIETKPISAALLKEGKIGIFALIKEVGFAPTTSEARRLVEGGGVTFAGQKVTDPKTTVSLEGEPVLQVGKRRVCKVVVS